MRISTKGRYGVRIMLDIAKNGFDLPVRIADISARQGISVKYTEQITGILVKSGLLKSVRGASGGYLLAKAPAEYTVGEILRKTEGDLAPVDCVNGGECERAEACAVQQFWNGLYDLINGYVDGVTLQDLSDRSPNGSDFYSI